MNGLILTWIVTSVIFGPIILLCAYRAIFKAIFIEVTYFNEYGDPRTKVVEDLKYYYEPEELWKPSSYWNTWQKVGNEPVVQKINHYGDDDWPHTENNA